MRKYEAILLEWRQVRLASEESNLRIEFYFYFLKLDAKNLLRTSGTHGTTTQIFPTLVSHRNEVNIISEWQTIRRKICA